MQEELQKMLAELGASLPDAEQGIRSLTLAGNGIARPIVALRARQAAMESARAALPLRRNNPARAGLKKMEAIGAAAIVGVVDAEIARTSLTPPKTGEGVAGVYGYVVADGKPVKGAKVELLAGKNSRASTETASDGSYALSVKTEEKLTLSASQGKLATVDTAGYYGPSPIAVYRILTLDDAPKDTKAPSKGDRLIEDQTQDKNPTKDTPSPKPLDPASLAKLRGQSINAGLKKLDDEKVTLAGIRMVDGKDRTPQIVGVTTHSKERAATLEISVLDRPSARLDIAAAILARESFAKDTPLETASSAREWLREHNISTLPDLQALADLKTDELAKRTKTRDQTTARKLKRSLTGAMQKIGEA